MSKFVVVADQGAFGVEAKDAKEAAGKYGFGARSVRKLDMRTKADIETWATLYNSDSIITDSGVRH